MEATIKTRIEKVVDANTDFNMAHLANTVWPLIEARPRVAGVIPRLRAALGNNYAKLAYAVLRNAFLIELVRIPKIETTKFRVRWVSQISNDPRYCPFEECLDIGEVLLESLPSWLETASHAEALGLSFTRGLIPYEVPLDYSQRLTRTRRVHERGNLTWFYDDLILRTLKLRKYLIDATTSPDPRFFRQVLNEKIKVKAYLTDRVLTGDHKTNREKRWETHPESVHFAERRTCMAIGIRSRDAAKESFEAMILE